MFAGLPGTGVGGILYLFLTLWMPFHELIMMARGRSTLGRWRFILRHWCLMGGVLAMIALQTAFMRMLIPAKQQAEFHASVAPVNSYLPTQVAGMLASTAMIALISLGVIFGMIHMVRVGLRLRQLANS